MSFESDFLSVSINGNLSPISHPLATIKCIRYGQTDRQTIDTYMYRAKDLYRIAVARQ